MAKIRGQGGGGGADRDDWLHRQDGEGRKRQHSGTFTTNKNIESYDTMTVRKMVDRLEKESGTSLAPPKPFKFGCGQVQVQEESPMKRRRLQQQNDSVPVLPLLRSKMKSKQQKNSPLRKRPVSGAPPWTMSSSSPWRPRAPASPAAQSVYRPAPPLEPGKLSTGTRWPPRQSKQDSTLPSPLSNRRGSGRTLAEAKLSGISNHPEEHPPQTVMPGQAVHHHQHLHHQGHQGRHHHPFDDSGPEHPRQPLQSNLRRIEVIKQSLINTSSKLETIEVGNIENIVRKKEDQKQEEKKEDEEDNDTNLHTNLLEPESETSPRARDSSSRILEGSCGSGASQTSSVGSCTTLGTSGGRGTTRGTWRGFPLEENIETLLERGENCRADAAYICTQFGTHTLYGGGAKTIGPVRTGQWERARICNPQAGLGLADEDQRAVAIPRGDCKFQQQHPSCRISSDKPDEV